MIFLFCLVYAGPAAAVHPPTQRSDWGVFVEPYAAYMSSTSEGTLKELGTEVKMTDSGTAFGGRLGYLFVAGPWLAVDYLRQSDTPVTLETPPTGNYIGSRNIVMLDLGYRGRYNGWSIWGGFGYSNTWDITRSVGGDVSYSGSAYKIGLGYRPVKYLSFNLEYIMNAYTTVKFALANKASVSETYYNWTSSSYVISISIPFTRIDDQ